jgi:type IV pilus assembly protein PilW
MKKFRFNTPQRGFTLIEMMIAMLIGVFLMAGVIQIFLSAKQAYRLQENLSRLQENGRLAMDGITKDMRMTGYVAYVCFPKPTTAPIAFDKADNVNNWCSSSNRSCVASVTSPASIANTVNNIRTDVIRSYQWDPTNWTTPPTTPTAADCTTASETGYFIRVDDSNSNIPALWRYTSIPTATGTGTFTTSTQERVEGIERMQVLYGVDTDLVPDYVPNYYADAATVAVNAAATPPVNDWNKVVSVRVTLLLVTMDNGLTDAPQPYTYNGTTTTPPDVCSSNGVVVSALPCSSPNIQVKDLRIRRVFSSTIAVRNRLL